VAPFAESWDGTGWSLLPPPPDSNAPPTTLAAISCASPTTCMAVGTQQQDSVFAEEWNAGTWTIVSPPVPSGSSDSAFSAVSCPGSDDCTAVGYIESGDVATPLVEHWGGSIWTPETVPLPMGLTQGELSSVSCPTSGRCTTVGYGWGNTEPSMTIAQHEAGAKWTAETPADLAGNDLNAVSCAAPDQCLAVGAVSVNGVSTTLADRWNGARWSIVPSESPGGGTDELLAVACQTEVFCVATGTTAAPATIGTTLAEQWNGVQLTATATPSPAFGPSFLAGVSCPTSAECMAVGFGPLTAKSAYQDAPFAALYQSSPQHILTVSVGGAGTVAGAELSCPGTCEESFADAEQVTLTATPGPGADFSGWSGGGCSGTGSCIVTMNTDVSVTATFTPTATVTPIPLPAHGSIAVTLGGTGTGLVTGPGIDCPATCLALIPEGDSVTLTAVPATGSTFSGWSAGSCTAIPTCTLTIRNDQSIVASFTAIVPEPSCIIAPEHDRVVLLSSKDGSQKFHTRSRHTSVLQFAVWCNEDARLAVTSRVTRAGEKLGTNRTRRRQTFTLKRVTGVARAGHIETMAVRLTAPIVNALRAGARPSVMATLTATGRTGTVRDTAQIPRLYPASGRAGSRLGRSRR
jgi:hypothetical protein